MTIPATSLQQNQLVQTPVQGMADLRFNGQTIACEVDVSSAGSLVPGQAVNMVDSAGGVPKVVESSADTDDVFGFIQLSPKDQVFNALDSVEISALHDNVMYMTAGAAISRYAKVMVVIASKKVITATTGKTIIGRALDKASADGDLIRVAIELPGSAA